MDDDSAEVASSAAIGAIGFILFDRSSDNWYVTVGAALLHDPRLAALPTAVLFLGLGIPSALFSPLGEELFRMSFVFGDDAIGMG